MHVHRTIGTSPADLGARGFKIAADPSTPLLDAFAAGQKVCAHLADGFGIKSQGTPDWAPTERAMLSAIDLEKRLAVERATVEKGKR